MYVILVEGNICNKAHIFGRFTPSHERVAADHEEQTSLLMILVFS